jgi:hypothetical protein
MTALLIFHRPASYRDRAVRYLVELDSRPQPPRLQSNHTIEVPVEPGEHLVRVSIGQRRFFQAPVTNQGETRRLLIVPGPLFSGLDRQPRLLDAATRHPLAGTVIRWPSPIEEPGARHHS